MKTIGNCGDCKWWDSGICKSGKFKFYDLEAKSLVRQNSVNVYAIGNDNQGGNIYIGSHFGCIHWERKEEKPKKIEKVTFIELTYKEAKYVKKCLNNYVDMSTVHDDSEVIESILSKMNQDRQDK